MINTARCQYSRDLLAESSSHCKTSKSTSNGDSYLNADGGNHECMVPIFSTYHLLTGEMAMDKVPKGGRQYQPSPWTFSAALAR